MGPLQWVGQPQRHRTPAGSFRKPNADPDSYAHAQSFAEAKTPKAETTAAEGIRR